jgi:membrane protease subunit (stomatin/prohibitin family)
MSIVGVFSRQRPQIGDFFFDATLEENTQLSTEVTQFPVEAGFVGNDHAVQQPLRITMRLGMTDNVFRAARYALPDGLGAAAGNLGGAAAGAGLAQLGGLGSTAAGLGIEAATAGYQAGQATTRTQAALDLVRTIQRANVPVSVVTLKKEYKDCMIVDTRQETNKENENALELVVEFVEMVTVDRAPGGAEQAAPGDPAATQGAETESLGLLVPQ